MSNGYNSDSLNLNLFNCISDIGTMIVPNNVSLLYNESDQRYVYTLLIRVSHIFIAGWLTFFYIVSLTIYYTNMS